MIAPILLGRDQVDVLLQPRYANRHGLIAGATGTGKTVTLQSLAESFSRIGTPVFMADVKGDLSGIAAPGAKTGKVGERIDQLALSDWQPEASPTVFWDLLADGGHRLRTTISEIGPLLLSRMLELTDVQEGVLNVAFKLADDEGLLLLDLFDLRSLLTHVSENAKAIGARYGNVAPASVAAIQRALLELENQGARGFFGEPALELADLLRTDLSGRGLIHILRAEKLFLKPRLYATVLLWLLSELFEELPEVGDLDKPRLVFFFDEAHLLFNDAPAALVQRIEQVVRLIRSKGVGVYFVTQSPTDLPEVVLGQLGNRVQHALRAFTPRDQKAVRTAAETFVQNPELDTAERITQMGVGQALVSTLGDKGIPSPVQQVFIPPPRSRLGPLDASELTRIRLNSPIGPRYDQEINRESAHEVLTARAAKFAAERAAAEAEKEAAEAQARAEKAAARSKPQREGMAEAFVKSAARAIGSNLGRQLLRGLLGGVTRRSR